METFSTDNVIHFQKQFFGNDSSLRVLKRRRKSSTASSRSDNSSAFSKSVYEKRITSFSVKAKQFFFCKVSSFLTSPEKSYNTPTNISASTVYPMTSQECLPSSTTSQSRKRPSAIQIDPFLGTSLLLNQASEISNLKSGSNTSKRRHISIKTTSLTTRTSSSRRFFSAFFKTQSQKQQRCEQQKYQQQHLESSQTSLDFESSVNDSVYGSGGNTSNYSNFTDPADFPINNISYHSNNKLSYNSENESANYTPDTLTQVLSMPSSHDVGNNKGINQSGRKLNQSGNNAAQTLGPALPILGNDQYLIQTSKIAATRDAFGYEDSSNYYNVVARPSVESFKSRMSNTSSVFFLCETDANPSHCELTQYSNKNSINTPPSASACVSQIPEIISLIVEHVDAFNPAPQEQRRSHDNKRTYPQHEKQSVSGKNTTMMNIGGTMLSCLLVNKLWYAETRRILYKNIHFKDETTIDAFMHFNELFDFYDNENGIITLSRPKSLVLHKISTLSQEKTDQLAEIVSGGLEWLEMYTCPKLIPNLAFAAGGQLRTLILPGCTALTDSALSQLARASPHLETLDLRACEQISDKSIRVVAHYCPQLTMLNVGRTRHGHRITNKGIRSIARHTRICVLGVAGCHITDTTVWELALHRGPFLERVSFNNCIHLSNASVPKILGYISRSLSVLEVKNLPLLTDLVPFVMFKRYRQYQFGLTPLIEGCELFDERLREAEYLFEMEISKQIFTDTLEWIYSPDDDIEYISID